jgi:hypothetical protein
MLDLRNSNYLTFIESIIEERGQWSDDLLYWEGHHIVPASFGGKGKTKDKHQNIIRLTPGEHFKAHKLLTLDFPDIPAFAQAFYIMANTFKVNSSWSNQRSVDISEEDFELARTLYLEAIKKDPTISGEGIRGRKAVYNEQLNIKKYIKPDELIDFLANNPDWRLGGPKHTEEELLKMRSKLTGSNNPMYGRKWTDDTREKVKKTREGKKWYTNGEQDIFCLPTEVPEGYYFGATHRKGRTGSSNPMWGKTSGTGKAVRCITTSEVFESKRKAMLAYKLTPYFVDKALASAEPLMFTDGKLYKFEYCSE